MPQRCPHQASQQPQRLGVPVAEGVGLRGNDLQKAENALFIPERNYEQRADPQIAICLMPDSLIVVGVVAPLQLASPNTEPRKTSIQLQSGRLAADVQQWH